MLLLQQLINGLSLGSVYALISVGFALIFSVLKFSNFAHGSVIMLSAYFGLWISNRFATSLWLTLLLCALAGGIVAVIIEKIGFRPIRLRGGSTIYFFVSSISISLFFESFMTALLGGQFYMYRNFFKETTISLGTLIIPWTSVLTLIVSSGALIFLLHVLYRTRIGIAIRAASTDLFTPNLMGADVDLIVSVAFFLSGVLAGISGLFLGINLTVYPQIGGLVIKGFVATVIGGLGSLSGAVFGALLLGMGETLITAYLGGSVTPIFSFSIMFIFLLLKPEGIAGLFGRSKLSL